MNFTQFLLSCVYYYDRIMKIKQGIFLHNILFTLFVFTMGIFIGFKINQYTPEIQSHRNNKKVIQSKIEEIKKNPVIQEVKINIPKEEIIKEEIVKEKIVKKTTKLKINPLQEFKSLLSSHEYQNAIFFYQQKINNNNKPQYDKILFSFIEKEISQNNLEIQKLLYSYLEFYYENPQALYYLNIIMYKQKNYQKSIDILYTIKSQYTNKKLEDKVLKELETNISLYLTILTKQSNTQKKLDFLEYLIDKDPQNNEYKYTLAKLYFDFKDYGKAKYLFENIYYDSLYQKNVSHYIDIINKKIQIQEKFQQKIPLQKQGTHFYINAIINRNIKVKLLIDTGASITLINDLLVKDLNLNLSSLKTIYLHTANGVVKTYSTKVESFSINNLSFNNFEVTIGKLNKNLDGLLGMNYLKNFDFYIDQDDAILYLNPL
jgi:clan AA aspartic protease (TIGR02281 family)